MEYQYKNNSWKLIFYCMLSIFFIIISIYFLFKSSYYILNIFYSLLLFVAAIFIYKFYTKSKSVVVRLNDSGISYKLGEQITNIEWDDITEVSWREKIPWDIGFGYSRYIVIKGKSKEIVIGEKIEGFPNIIQSIKRKVGSRFNTYDIPWELKNPTERNYKER